MCKRNDSPPSPLFPQLLHKACELSRSLESTHRPSSFSGQGSPARLLLKPTGASVCNIPTAELRAVGKEKEARKEARAERAAGEQGHRAHGGPGAWGLGPGSAPTSCSGLSWTRFPSLPQFLSISRP